MRVVGLNHVSVHCYDLAASTAFYVEVLGLVTVPSFTCSTPVAWLQLGPIQLHLIRTEDPAPRSHHLALEVDDFTAAYLQATELGIREREIPVFSLADALGELEQVLAAGDGPVRLNEDGDLVISPLTAEDVPTEAVALKAELTEMLPFAPIVSLLIELDKRTGFLDCFTHAGGKQTRTAR